MEYKLVISGGTFDQFHEGHKAFLKGALSLSEHILLGITSDTYVMQHKKTVNSIQSFVQRKSSVEAFLKKENAVDRVTIAPIDSILYPKAWEILSIEAIVVTQDTKKGAEIINDDRKKKGLTQLAVVIIPLMHTDKGEKISSTYIREGKISNHGISYVQQSWFSKDLVLPELEKQWFKKPFGNLLTDISLLQKEDPTMLVTVGDVVTHDCNTHGISQKLSVIDFTVQRKKTHATLQDIGFSGGETVFVADNPTSHITPSLFHAITQATFLLSDEKQLVIIVHGEEDLAVIPLVLTLPLNFVIAYGQPHEGIVRLPVTPESKNHAYTLLQKFISQEQ